MSSLKVHALQGVAITAALYPFIGDQALTVGLANVFIDVDHVIEYVRDTGSYDVRGVFAYSHLIEKNLDKNFSSSVPSTPLNFLSSCSACQFCSRPWFM